MHAITLLKEQGCVQYSPPNRIRSVAPILSEAKMFRVIIGRSVFQPCKSRASLPQTRHFRPSLLSYERHRASPSGKKKTKKKGQKRSKRRGKQKAEEKQANQWLPQDERVSPTKTTTEPADILSSLPLEIWSKSKADATWFHGREALGLEWSSPSVQTSEHPAVKAVLQDVASRTRNDR